MSWYALTHAVVHTYSSRDKKVKQLLDSSHYSSHGIHSLRLWYTLGIHLYIAVSCYSIFI